MIFFFIRKCLHHDNLYCPLNQKLDFMNFVDHYIIQKYLQQYNLWSFSLTWDRWQGGSALDCHHYVYKGLDGPHLFKWISYYFIKVPSRNHLFACCRICNWIGVANMRCLSLSTWMSSIKKSWHCRYSVSIYKKKILKS